MVECRLAGESQRILMVCGRYHMGPSGERLHLAQITRRRLILAGSCAACSTIAESVVSRAAGASRRFSGCFISPLGYEQFKLDNPLMSDTTARLYERDRYVHSTGDPTIDRDLDRAMGLVADLMNVMPAFGFYEPTKFFDSDDPDTWIMNAWASPQNTAIPGTRGTVGFGFDLFRRELYEYDNTGSTIMAIVAHEFAHVLQGNRGYLARIQYGNPLKSEINADFLSGYFLGSRKRHNPKLSFQKAGELFIRLGKQVEGRATRTHGNSQERLDAAEAGFRAAYIANMSLDDAVAAGLEYVGDRAF